jgi:hypothetical protein
MARRFWYLSAMAEDGKNLTIMRILANWSR